MDELELKPSSAALGVEVRGVELSGALDSEIADRLRAAFVEHVVLVFRDQSLTPEGLLAFTRLFGEPMAHPLNTRRHLDGFPDILVLENQPGLPSARNDYWHSDISHLERPPTATLLYARTVPEGRGDTMYCNMRRAYEALSAGMKDAIANLRAWHSPEATIRRNNEEHNDGLPIVDPPPPHLHPVVRTHPDTGHRALYINPHFTTHFEDMTREESRTLMEPLIAQATRPENIYRHHWREGDLVMWDNRSAMHYAVRDYDETMPRLMWRTTTAGEVPT